MPDPSSEMIPAKRIQYLFERYMNHSITAADEQELAELVLAPENEKIIVELEQEYWNKETGVELTREEGESYLAKIIQSSPAKIRRMIWRRIAVAASIVFLMGLGGYLLLFTNKNASESIEVHVPTKDVQAPETNRAMITLADGRVVYLDSVVNGELAMVNGVKLVKRADGEIVYSRESLVDSQESIVPYNTLRNPKGSKVIHMQLSDGSHVWLNAGSSVTYPVLFAGNERKVSITGEAYFEVNGQRSMVNGERVPFKVTKNEMEVKVLGTKFNVNAYDDEDDIKVTLLEGSVGVSTVHRSQLTVIKPGEQAIIDTKYEVKSAKADVEAVMAWKNGRFVFGDKADIQTIMRQIARWYDVDVEYRGTITKHFGGSISRQVNVSEVFKVLEATGGVKCKVEGRKVIVESAGP